MAFMEKDLALSIDCGTQSVRAMVFDKGGDAVASSAVVYDEPYFSPEKDWAEQDPQYWWGALRRCLGSLFSKLGSERARRLCGAAISTMRETYVCLDKDLRVLRPSIVWLDQRIARRLPKMGLLHSLLFKLVGMYDTVMQQRRVTRPCWIADRQPEIYARMEHFVPLGCWFNLLLTGRLVDAVGNQCGHVPFDYKKGVWRKDGSLMWEALPVETRLLPPLVPSGSLIGHITPEASRETGIPAGLPLYGGATDKGCETLGCGAVDGSMAVISYGTTATVQLALDRYMEPQRFLPSYPAACPGKWNPEIQIWRGYWMVKWFARNFGFEEMEESRRTGQPVEPLLNRLLDQTPPGCDGLVLQPYWCPGLKLLESKGSIIGFSDYHTKAHLYRAIIEGIAYGLREGLERLVRRSGAPVGSLCLTGGGSKSDAICRLTSDVFGLPARRCQTDQTSALGAAMLAFVGAGEFSSYEEAAASMVRYPDSFEPDMRNNKVYNQIFRDLYKRLYPRLRPLYKRAFRSSLRDGDSR